MGFTGREYDAETGLYYYRARHYDPLTGRFLQSDPLGFGGGDMNLYAYTWNDPANWTDPSGLSPSTNFARLTAGTANLARGVSARVGAAARCVANRISTALAGVARVVALGRDLHRARIRAHPRISCRTQVVAPRCGCKSRGGDLGAGASGSSFVRGTEVRTPDGPVAIETLREGDMVIARDEEGGISGIFPVTAIMQRQTAAALYLTLENGAGETSVLGVTAEHPLFDVSAGWTQAGDLVAGDVVVDRDMQPLTLLAIRVDDTPQLVHNLEIGGAHTYFAGEMAAWAHNARRRIGPIDDAWGPHTVLKFFPCPGGGRRLIQYATYIPNLNPLDPKKWTILKRVDLDPDSAPHCGIPTPHTNSLGVTRPSLPSEIP